MSEPDMGAVVRRRVTSLRPARVDCAWCGQTISVAARGRVPTWCGSVCRHRAWEQHRAAASGLAARKVVERVVERTVTLTVRVPTPAPKPVKQNEPQAPTRADHWVRALDELVKQIDAGRIYPRDIDSVSAALTRALDAASRQRYYLRR